MPKRLVHDHWLVYDVVFEGVSLAVTNRSMFSQKIRDLGIDGVIAELKARYCLNYDRDSELIQRLFEIDADLTGHCRGPLGSHAPGVGEHEKQGRVIQQTLFEGRYIPTGQQ